MIITTEGIVLKQKSIAGNRRMITVFTKSYGKISAGTTICERGKSKSALSIRPFTFAEYEIFKGRDSYNINNAQVRRSFFSIGENLDRFMIASKLMEYLNDVLAEGKPATRLFDLTIEFFETISKAESGFDTILYAYIAKSLRILGISPELKCCVYCGKPLYEFFENSKIRTPYLFSVTAGGILCEQCGERVKTNSQILIKRPSFDIVEVLNYFQNKPLGNFEKVNLKIDIKDEVRVILNEYLSYYLDTDVLNDSLI